MRRKCFVVLGVLVLVFAAASFQCAHAQEKTASSEVYQTSFDTSSVIPDGSSIEDLEAAKAAAYNEISIQNDVELSRSEYMELSGDGTGEQVVILEVPYLDTSLMTIESAYHTISLESLILTGSGETEIPEGSTAADLLPDIGSGDGTADVTFSPIDIPLGSDGMTPITEPEIPVATTDTGSVSAELTVEIVSSEAANAKGAEAVQSAGSQRSERAQEVSKGAEMRNVPDLPEPGKKK